MPLMPPPAVNYPSPLFFRPSTMLAQWGQPPGKEGPGSISAEIDWVTMGGPGNCVTLNPGANPINPNQISQIAALYVNNFSCQSNVTFLFTDTGLAITVPSFSGGLFPVVSNSLQFFVTAAAPILGDETLFLMLNVCPPPVVIPQPSLTTTTAVFDNIAATAGTTALIAAPTDGTLRGVSVGVALGATGGNWMTWQLKDGTGAVILGGQFADNATASGVATNGLIYNSDSLDLAFNDGLNLVLALVAGAGFGAHAAVTVNLQYETP